jgi:5-deoxy-glucuronate isomerase
VAIVPGEEGWQHAGLRVLDLAPGGRITFATGDEEALVLPLSGSCVVECEGTRVELLGRSGVFAGATDFVYVPVQSSVTVTSGPGGRFAVPSSPAQRRLPVRRQPAGSVDVATRGAGVCSRLVRDYCMPGGFDADRLMVCEVFTPAGNWSSYPPHKHDETSEHESCLEEVYYFEVADGPGGPGVGYHRVYGTERRPVDLLAEVRGGDVVLVPHGYHGPSIASPGNDLYYLNVMAGARERAWRACDDPALAWVRESWRGREADPRVRAALPQRRER